MYVSSCASTNSVEISMEIYTVSILSAAYNHFIVPFLYIITVEVQFDVMITLNVHAVRKEICLATTRHADRRGKPLFFAHLELPYFLDHKNHSPRKELYKMPLRLLV